MTPKFPLLVGLLMLSACGATTSTGTPSATSTSPATTSATATPVPSASVSVPAVAGLPRCGDRATLGILGAVVATATNPDGSAKDPATSFPSASTTRIVVVVSIRGVAVGTKLSFTRYRDGRFVDSRSAVIAKPATYFYFDFTAQPGQHIATGTYQVRLYVNEARACAVTYAVV